MKIFIYLFILCLSVNAQTVFKSDTVENSFKLENNNTNYLDSIRNDSQFKYNLEDEKEEESTFLNWLKDLFDLSPLFITFLFWLVVFILVMSIIYYLAKQEVGWIFKPKEKIIFNSSSSLTHEADNQRFENLIEKALKDKNYKLVIHYYYKHILNVLASKKIISLAKEKTNMEYSYEIKKKDIKKFFNTFTREFEYIYYGDFKVTEPIINEITNQYQTFLKSMSK